MNKNKKLTLINMFLICLAIALFVLLIITRTYYTYSKEEINFRAGNSGIWSMVIINDVDIADKNINTFMLNNLEKMSESLIKLKKTKNDTYIKEQIQSFIYLMKNNPELLQPYLEDILKICILLNEDYSDINAYEKIEELINNAER